MQPLQATDSAASAIQRVNYKHDAIVDAILAQPWISGSELARQFGYTQPWISRIVCSEAFQARLADRKGEAISPLIAASFEDRLKGLAMQSLEIIEEKLAEVDKMGKHDTGTAFKALELSSRSLGYGARGSAVNVAIQNNVKVTSASDEQLLAIANGGDGECITV